MKSSVRVAVASVAAGLAATMVLAVSVSSDVGAVATRTSIPFHVLYTVPHPSDTGSLVQGLDCTSTTVCDAVAFTATVQVTPTDIIDNEHYEFGTSTNGAHSWVWKPAPFLGLYGFSGLSCENRLVCVVLQALSYRTGSTISTYNIPYETVNAGSTWTEVGHFGPGDILAPPSCTKTTCVIVGGVYSASALPKSTGAPGILIYTNGATRVWTNATLPHESFVLSAAQMVSCWSTNCLAYGIEGSSYTPSYVLTSTTDGQKWSLARSVTSIPHLYPQISTACQTFTQCEMGYFLDEGFGYARDFGTTNGWKSWAFAGPIAPMTGVTVRCLTATHCVGVGDRSSCIQTLSPGSAYGCSTWAAYAGTATSATGRLTLATVPTGISPFSAISCPSSTLCFAGTAGDPYVGDTFGRNGQIVSF
jgi:hypothetical protein